MNQYIIEFILGLISGAFLGVTGIAGKRIACSVIGYSKENFKC